MTKRIALGGVAVVALAAVLAGGVARAAGAQAPGPDPIAVRKAGFTLQLGDFVFIKSVVKAKGNVKVLALPARGIAAWATQIPTLFPAGSEKGENTKALPAIWSNPSGFAARAHKLHNAALKLAMDAKAGNAALVAEDMRAVGHQCGACHHDFRAR